MDESREFQIWLQKNKQRLRGYSSDEIVYLALLNGFSIAVACANTCDHLTHLKRLLEFWENPLSENWLRVTAYEHGHDDEMAA